MFETDPQTLAYIQAYLFEAGKIVLFWELCRWVFGGLYRDWKRESQMMEEL